MFSKFKLEKPKKVIYRRGARPYEREHPSHVVSLPILEQYDRIISALEEENEILKNEKSAADQLLTVQYNELVKHAQKPSS